MGDIILVILLVCEVVSLMLLFALGLITVSKAKQDADRHQEVIDGFKFLAEQNMDVLDINREYLSLPVKKDGD